MCHCCRGLTSCTQHFLGEILSEPMNPATIMASQNKTVVLVLIVSCVFVLSSIAGAGGYYEYYYKTSSTSSTAVAPVAGGTLTQDQLTALQDSSKTYIRAEMAALKPPPVATLHRLRIIYVLCQ